MDYELLKSVCLSPIDNFEIFGDITETNDGIYIYRDNGSKVLGVAHLDSVLNLEHFHVVDINGDEIVINAQLDDRLGAYTLLYTLPELGIEFDLLLTEGEESGNSTAAYFETNKDYNWIFSFDRRGEDVVLYQYEAKSITDALKRSKFKIGIGSFSDIAFLEHLNAKAFNVGTGYEGEHSEMCHANMSTLNRQVNRFYNFYHANKDTRFSHVKSVKAIKQYSKSYLPLNYSNLYNDKFDNTWCYMCQNKVGKHMISDDSWLCDACFVAVEACQVCGELVYSDEVMSGICMDCIDEQLGK